MEVALDTKERIASITLDDASIIRRAADVERERATAIADLLASNSFAPYCVQAGPYDIFLSTRDNRLLLRISSAAMDNPREVILPIKPFKQIVKDYFLICESYFEAMNTHQPHRVEALDMARRGIHNEGAEVLLNQLEDRIVLDFDTARRLFTLICVLHIR